MPARTLEEAFNLLDPRQPIRPEDVPTLFVPRPYSPVKSLKAQLLLSRSHQKFLFVGHRGAGKSSEMAYLSTLVEDKFLTIFVPLYNIYQSPVVNHIELTFALALRLFQAATDEKIIPKGLITESWEQILEKIYRPLRQRLFGPDPITSDSQTTFTAKLNLLVTELEVKIGTEAYTRAQVKEKFDGRTNELLNDIRLVSQEMERKLNRRLLVVVEDLDKFDIAAVRDLFKDYSRTLTEPYPTIIYTFPIEMRHDQTYKTIEQGFDKVFTLPNIAIENRDGSANAKGQETMWLILLKRLEPALFADGVLRNVIKWSGGHVKTLIQMVRYAILEAVVDGNDLVVETHLDKARRLLRDDYMVLLKKEQIELLCQLRNDPDKSLVNVTPEKQSLLQNLSLLEYNYNNSNGPWVGINPVVQELLEREWN